MADFDKLKDYKRQANQAQNEIFRAYQEKEEQKYIALSFLSKPSRHRCLMELAKERLRLFTSKGNNSDYTLQNAYDEVKSEYIAALAKSRTKNNTEHTRKTSILPPSNKK